MWGSAVSFFGPAPYFERNAAPRTPAHGGCERAFPNLFPSGRHPGSETSFRIERIVRTTGPRSRSPSFPEACLCAGAVP